MELGIYTFADVQPDRLPGKAVNTHQRIKDLLEEIQGQVFTYFKSMLVVQQRGSFDAQKLIKQK